jgi:hypothetical protein
VVQVGYLTDALASLWGNIGFSTVGLMFRGPDVSGANLCKDMN